MALGLRIVSLKDISTHTGQIVVLRTGIQLFKIHIVVAVAIFPILCKFSSGATYINMDYGKRIKEKNWQTFKS